MVQAFAVIGTVVAMTVKTMVTGDLQGVHLIEAAVVIPLDVRPIMVVGQGEIVPGHPILLIDNFERVFDTTHHNVYAMKVGPLWYQLCELGLYCGVKTISLLNVKLWINYH